MTLVCVSLLAGKVEKEEITRDVLAFISWSDIHLDDFASVSNYHAQPVGRPYFVNKNI